jgi:uncharacterized repeat protein (TIGR03803 family)
MRTGLQYINSMRRLHLQAPANALLLMLALGTAAALHAQQSADKSLTGTYSLLYSFQWGSDGAFPFSGLVRDSSGNLYGTTSYDGQLGYGTVFKITSGGTETVLHSFAGSPSDGQSPQYASLTLDATGNVYGTTAYGGEFGYGTVFEVATTGTESVLYNFTGGADGSQPYGGLVRDGAGNLYGTTVSGGAYGQGVVFTLTPGGTESVLHDFGSSPTDGKEPTSDLTRDSSGNLYGTTKDGGAFSYGTVFEVSASGTESVLYSFKGSPTDGANPGHGGLLRDASGNLYGVTHSGGANGYGTVFKLTPRGAESVLLNFNFGDGGGIYPIDGLAADAAGNLYGTTSAGGAGGLACPFQGCGVLFRLTTTGKEVVLHSFSTGSSDGGHSAGCVVRDPSGNLYGTLVEGGTYSGGAVFKFTP